MDNLYQHPLVQAPIVTTPVQIFDGIWIEPIITGGY